MALSPRPAPRIVPVLRNETLTPHMRRITLDGSCLEDFPEGRETANFKLFLPRPGQAEPLLADPGADLDPELKPIVRTYTLRHYDPVSGEIWIEFALHDHAGPATAWALTARPGDRCGISYPSEPKPVPANADWVLLAGDMTALSTIAVLAERLPRDTRGYAVLEIAASSDRQVLAFPPGVEVQWLVNPTPREPSDLLLNAVRKLAWHAGQPGVWVAGEAGVVRNLKHYFKEERGVPRQQIYISGYWQIGLTEDAHQKIKRLDADY